MNNTKFQKPKNGNALGMMIRFFKISTLLTNLVITSFIATPSKVLSHKSAVANANSQIINSQNKNRYQERKLWLVNNTPYIGIITLYRPNEQYAARYVHIPPCHVRKLSAIYSTKWKVRFNYEQIYYPIGNVISNPKDDVFKVKASDLVSNENLLGSCKENRVQYKDVVQINYLEECLNALKKIAQGFLNLKLGITPQNTTARKAVVKVNEVSSDPILNGQALIAEGLKDFQKFFLEWINIPNSPNATNLLAAIANKNLDEANVILVKNGGYKINVFQKKMVETFMKDQTELYARLDKSTHQKLGPIIERPPQKPVTMSTNLYPILSYAR